MSYKMEVPTQIHSMEDIKFQQFISQPSFVSNENNSNISDFSDVTSLLLDSSRSNLKNNTYINIS